MAGESKSIRVLHCPLAIGGGPPGLARAERLVGLTSTCVAFEAGPYQYQCDEVLWSSGEKFLSKELKRWGLFRRALGDFDVVHFNFGLSILTWGGLFSNRAHLSIVDRLLLPFARYLELLDVPALRRAGKVIAVT